MDKGEAETIIIAAEINADLIIVNEILGRYYAKNAGLKLPGTLGVLLKAKTEIKPLIYE